MITLQAYIEVPEATTVDEARDMLEAFREAVQPSMNYGLIIAEDYDRPPLVGECVPVDASEPGKAD